MSSNVTLTGPRFELSIHSKEYPEILRSIPSPPSRLYGIGNPEVLRDGVSIIGARKATPYGLSCASRFAHQAASRGLIIISGGALGCDQAAHEAAINEGTPTVVVFGSGADVCYPRRGFSLFEQVIEQGGAIVSENTWQTPPCRGCFPRRNRIIAGLARLLLIAEAGLPSGTFSTADAALAQGKEVAVVPGAITSPYARGSNYLISQGACPIFDTQSFDSALDRAFSLYPFSMTCTSPEKEVQNCIVSEEADPILLALSADAYSPEELSAYFGFSVTELLARLSRYEMQGLICRRRDGRYQVA